MSSASCFCWRLPDSWCLVKCSISWERNFCDLYADKDNNGTKALSVRKNMSAVANSVHSEYVWSTKMPLLLLKSAITDFKKLFSCAMNTLEAESSPTTLVQFDTNLACFSKILLIDIRLYKVYVWINQTTWDRFFPALLLVMTLECNSLFAQASHSLMFYLGLPSSLSKYVSFFPLL